MLSLHTVWSHSQQSVKAMKSGLDIVPKKARFSASVYVLVLNMQKAMLSQTSQ